MELTCNPFVKPPDDAIEAARRLLGAFPALHPLEAGSQTNVWRLSHGGNSLVLRVAKQNGDLGLITDLRIRTSLGSSRFVPRNRQSGQTGDGKVWLIDEYVSARHPLRAEIGENATRQMGTVLSELHQIPVSGAGRINPKTADFCGDASSVWDGLFSRFDFGPEPDDLDATTHKVLSDWPELRAAAATSLQDLQSELQMSMPVVCHADLHEKQIFLEGDNLLGVIDFGHAVSAAPCIDFASFVYFHGLGTLAALGDGYRINGAVPPRPSVCLKAVVGIAIHHLFRSTLPGKERRREFALRRLHEVIGAGTRALI